MPVQAKTRIQELYPCVPGRQQVPSQLNHYPLPATVLIGRNQSKEVLKPRHSNTGCLYSKRSYPALSAPGQSFQKDLTIPCQFPPAPLSCPYIFIKSFLQCTSWKRTAVVAPNIMSVRAGQRTLQSLRFCQSHVNINHNTQECLGEEVELNEIRKQYVSSPSLHSSFPLPYNSTSQKYNSKISSEIFGHRTRIGDNCVPLLPSNYKKKDKKYGQESCNIVISR